MPRRPGDLSLRDNCVLGHPLDGLNARGSRYCKTCARQAEARCRARARADEETRA